MTERLEVYVCAECKNAVAVLHGGPGELTCCGNPMGLVRESPEIDVPGEEALMDPPLMEHNLTMPIKLAMEYMQKRIANKTTYFGVTTLKNPLDFWVYREIIFEVKPDVVIEIGNGYGGGALALAHVFDHMDHGRVIGLDYQHDTVPEFVRAHPRITFLDGHAADLYPEVAALIRKGERVLVIEDSEHSYDNTLRMLRLYGPLVTAGSYLIVEDSNCHHGVDVGPSPGAYEAIDTFIAETDDFIIDRSRESFVITWNPKGYLKRL